MKDENYDYGLDLEEEQRRAEYCYECGGYGDDYHIDENGDLVSSCPGCPFGIEDD